VLVKLVHARVAAPAGDQRPVDGEGGDERKSEPDAEAPPSWTGTPAATIGRKLSA